MSQEFSGEFEPIILGGDQDIFNFIKNFDIDAIRGSLPKIPYTLEIPQYINDFSVDGKIVDLDGLVDPYNISYGAIPGLDGDEEVSAKQDSPITETEDDIDPETAEFLKATRAVFDLEHKLREPPKPRPSRFDDIYLVRHLTSDRDIINDFKMLRRDFEPRPEPTLDERIESLENQPDWEKGRERMDEKYNTDYRARNNFGQEFKVTTKFDITTEDILDRSRRRRAAERGEDREIKEDPIKVVGLSNRVSLYRYLQQIGLVLIDDTGMSAYAHDSSQTDHDKGALFLPESIERSVFYEFEDVVRELAPFSKHEIDLAMLRAERDQDRKIDLEELRVEDEKMREIVDILSLDERFMGMFEQSDALQKARQARRRETLDNDDSDDGSEFDDEIIC